MDVDKLPRVKPENVLILKYYSFENYFLNPSVMAKLGICGVGGGILRDSLGEMEQLPEENQERAAAAGGPGAGILGPRRICGPTWRRSASTMRGHNLYDIFYGDTKGRRQSC